jgi:hypothetical protein
LTDVYVILNTADLVGLLYVPGCLVCYFGMFEAEFSIIITWSMEVEKINFFYDGKHVHP